MKNIFMVLLAIFTGTLSWGFENGLKYIETGSTDEIIKTAKQLEKMKKSGSNDELDYILNILYINSEDLGMIFNVNGKYGQKINETDTDNFFYLLLKAEMLLNNKKYSDARKYFYKAQNNNTHEIEITDYEKDYIKLRVAETYYSEEKYSEIGNILREVGDKKRLKYEKLDLNTAFQLKKYRDVIDKYYGYRELNNESHYKNIYYVSMIKTGQTVEAKRQLAKKISAENIYLYIMALEREKNLIGAAVAYVALSFEKIISPGFMIITAIFIFFHYAGARRIKKSEKSLPVNSKIGIITIYFLLSGYIVFGNLIGGMVNLIMSGSILWDSGDKSGAMISAALSQVILTFIFLFLTIRIIGRNDLKKEIFGKLKTNFLIKGLIIYGLSFIILIAVSLITLPVTNYLSKYFDKESPVEFIIKGLSQNTPVLIIFFMTLSILGPYFEEIFFRGLIYNAFKESTKPMTAMILSALVFAIMHFQFISVIPLFVLGFSFAYFYEKEKSIFPVFAAHGINNFISGILTFLR